MSRALYPASHLTETQIDAMREVAERQTLIECARRTGKSVYLRGGPGQDTAAAGIDGKLVASPGLAELVCRALLANTDLNIAIVSANDIWQTGALVAVTLLTYADHQLEEDEVVSIYGAAMEDANPSAVRVDLQVGTPIVLAMWDLMPLYATSEPVGFTDEAPLWGGRDVVRINVLPRNTKAAPGDRLIFHGFIAQPKGRIITK